MRIPKYLLLLSFGVMAVGLGGLTATAQTATDYRFLEVTDTAGKPLVGATAEPVGSGTMDTKTTDAKGKTRVEIIYGDYNTHAIRVAKPGYTTEELPVSWHHESTPLDDELPPYDPHRPIRVIMLRPPARGQTIGPDEAERRRRELVTAVKNSWASIVTALIRDGVSPDTADQNGIPIILWASVSKYQNVLPALLAAGADVKKPGGLGRKALLYYLIVHFHDPDLDLVRALIRAGADLNATTSSKITPLSAAEYTKNAKLIELVKNAGAK
jgi:hypothetical protein